MLTLSNMIYDNSEFIIANYISEKLIEFNNIIALKFENIKK